MFVGIDLGTTHSLVAVWQDGKARLVPNALGQVLTPSVVSVDKDGSLLVIPLVERLEIVRSIRYVDAAFVETVPDKVTTWQQVRFDVLFKGDDWRGTAKGEKLERDFRQVGVEVVYFPYTVHTSSTQLRGALDALAARVEQG